MIQKSGRPETRLPDQKLVCQKWCFKNWSSWSFRVMESIAVCRPREIRLATKEFPLILYTDASDVPDRDPRFLVGGVLVDRRHEKIFIVISTGLSPKPWLPDGSPWILAGAIALATWGSSPLESKCIHLIR